MTTMALSINTVTSESVVRPPSIYVGIDVGYRTHVAAACGLQDFNPQRGRDAWRRVRTVQFTADAAGFAHLQRYLDRFSLDPVDFLVLLEPTGDHIEAGCQGTLHVRAHFEGERAHSARPWKGRNAIYAAADVLERLAAHEPDTVLVDGLPYRESLQVVRIEGGVANNVVPDECTIVVNRRFAPKYSVDEARAQVEKLLEGADRVEVINASPAAPPNLGDPLTAEFVEVLRLDVEPKLGWTDVARFASRDIPAVNFGPGDPDVAHTADERVTRASVEQCYAAFARFLGLAA